jgi:hypothetical protein
MAGRRVDIKTMTTSVGCLLVLATVTSASAETGWYLMFAPIDTQGVIALDRPLNTWTQIDTFATVAACQRDKARQEQEALNWVTDVQARMKPGWGKALGDEYVAATGAWAMTARALCIASNDPRLR